MLIPAMSGSITATCLSRAIPESHCNLGFFGPLFKSPNNFGVLPLFLIFNPVKIAVGYEPIRLRAFP